jgi:DNA-binding transcriptional LysR family regulator
MSSFHFQKTGAFEWRNLKAFVTVCEELHFGRAAARLNILQPQLSSLIRRLEEVLGQQLLVRRPVVRLTSAGRSFLPYARRAIDEVAEGAIAATNAASGEIGRIEIGYPTWIAPTFVPETIARFRQSHPAVNLHLRTMATADQIAELKGGRLDIAFLRDLKSDDEIHLELLFTEPWVVALPHRHPKSIKSSLRAKDLEGEDMIAFPSSAPWVRRRIEQLLGSNGSRRIVQEAQSWFAILSLVKAGLGCAVVPRSQMSMWGQDIEWRPLRGSPMKSEVAVARVASCENPVVGVFMNLLKEAAHQVLAEPDRPAMQPLGSTITGKQADPLRAQSSH